MITSRDTPVLCFGTWRGIGMIAPKLPGVTSVKDLLPLNRDPDMNPHSETDGIECTGNDVEEGV